MLGDRAWHAAGPDSGVMGTRSNVHTSILKLGTSSAWDKRSCDNMTASHKSHLVGRRLIRVTL